MRIIGEFAHLAVDGFILGASIAAYRMSEFAVFAICAVVAAGLLTLDVFYLFKEIKRYEQP